jgi:hypothetical protein
VHAALVAQLRVHAIALDHGDHFLDAALPGERLRDDVQLPALPLREAGVHPEDLGGEEGRFLAAGARPDLQQDVLLVVGILGDQQQGDLGVQRVPPGLERVQLLVGHLPQLRVRLHPDHLLHLRELGQHALVGPVALHDGDDVLRLAGQLLVGGRVPCDVLVGHPRLDLAQAGLDVLQLLERDSVHSFTLILRPDKQRPRDGRWPQRGR